MIKVGCLGGFWYLVNAMLFNNPPNGITGVVMSYYIYFYHVYIK